jgi:hypothetical protein
MVGVVIGELFSAYHPASVVSFTQAVDAAFGRVSKFCV